MRLHRLELSGFGPYPDRVVVDFDALASDGLFLLHGDTGAGKTSLLDAVAFALFAKVPGARDDAQRLRCDTTPAHTETRVSLELTVADQRFRISRTPRYERPKSRGSGTTVSQATANLAWIGEPPPGRAPGGTDRVAEVGMIVGELLGMNADQFFQVVLLPQGEFARFLRADTDHREKLLEKLFDTGRFGRVEDWFAAARRDSGAALRDAEEVSRRTAAQIAQAAGWRGDLPERPDEGWLAGVRELLHARRDLASQTLRAAEHARQHAREQLRRVVEMHARHGRLRDLRRREQLVALSEPERAVWRRQLDDARRAAPVAAAAAAWRRAQEQLDAEVELRDRSIERSVAGARDLGAALVPPARQLTEPGHARSAVATLRDQAGELTALVAESARQQSDLALRETLGHRLDRLVTAAQEIHAEHRALPAEIDVLADQVHHLHVRAAGLESARSVAAAATAALDVARSRPAAEAAVAAAVDRAQAAVDAAQLATQRRLDLTRRRIEDMASELASSLHPGDACPVCGSPEHPAIADSVADPVSAEDQRRGEEDEAVAIAARDAAGRRRVDAAHRLDLITAQLAGRTVDELAAEAAVAAQALAEAQAASTALDPTTARLRDLRARHEALTTRMSELTVDRASLEAERSTVSEAIDARAARLDAAAAGQPSVSHRRRQLLAAADALDAVDAAVHRVLAAKRSVTQCWAAVAAALADTDFTDLDAADAAAGVDPAVVSTALQAADADAAHLAALLDGFDAHPDDEHLLTLDADDLAAAVTAGEAAASTAERSATAAYADSSAADERVRDVQRLTGTIRRHWARLAPQAAADAELSSLTDVVLGRGDNRLRISLRAYVLAAWLREVATAANARLAVLTGGRYSFIHSTGKEARGRAGGLGLEVLDQYSGRTRPTKTLSGGESFLASLALALGLADVVAAQSSSSLLNTLFIDEGFGSLDAESLDLVMETLDTLRGEGRVIGVVSHVDELRQRIPARLRVRRHIHGSTVEMSVAG